MPAFSDVERVLALLGDGIEDSVQVMTAARVAAERYPQLNPGQPLLISGLEDEALARKVQSLLLAAYPSQHAVALVDGHSRRRIGLGQLGDAAGGQGHADWLYVPPLPHAADYTALQEIVAHLRAPDGCPWDRELTWDKLRASLLEETYELLAALDAGDTEKVVEEQGDLLLQIAMQAQIALEEGFFRSTDVIRNIVDKLVRRHPHVFGDTKVSGSQEVLANWEAIKRAERERKDEKPSPLSGVPASLPALAQADAYLDRMSRLQEMQTPVAPWSGLAALAQDATVTPEMFGEALLGMVAWARARGIEAESALRAANARFAAEVEAASDGRRPQP